MYNNLHSTGEYLYKTYIYHLIQIKHIFYSKTYSQFEYRLFGEKSIGST